jgi:hypothetical protein
VVAACAGSPSVRSVHVLLLELGKGSFHHLYLDHFVHHNHQMGFGPCPEEADFVLFVLFVLPFA